MFLSVFDLFKIGIGPSSSHTVGPMVAMGRFVDDLVTAGTLKQTSSVRVTLTGSLAFTGKGHATDRAVVLGLLGARPASIDPAAVEGMVAKVSDSKRLPLGGKHDIAFDPEHDIVFDYGEPMPEHTNGLVAVAFDASGATLAEEVYFSVGGGFVVTRGEIADFMSQGVNYPNVPYPFETAQQMLEMGAKGGLSIADMKRANELEEMSGWELGAKLTKLWSVMNACIERGMSSEGSLPGGLKVRRRASSIAQQLRDERGKNMKLEHTVMDWISLYAMAVNEENAAGGQVVTAPTNGAAGVIPATIRYYLDFCPGADEEKVEEFLLTAAAIGGIIKTNASISGAEVGCQGEVGSAAAMAAAGLCAVLGGTNEQIENAAEIAIEHHLGMTCDPVGGLVQVPCIERNAMGAVKAVNAASLALRGDGKHFVPLDTVIETMRQTGVDMLSKYKETSQGGLAVNITEC